MIHTSFVMAVCNRSKYLRNTLKGYMRHAPYDGVELVVVDYGSTDNLGEVLKEARGVFERIRYLNLDRSRSTIPINTIFNNPAAPLNVAVRAAKSPFLIMSPPECYPLADNIRVAYRLMGGGKRKVSLLGKALGMPESASELMEGGRWLPVGEDEVYKHIPRHTISVWASQKDHVLRGVPFFMAFRKEDHDKVNGIDEEYSRGAGGEDTDYLRRLRAAGAPHVWDDRCVVFHQWHPRFPRAPRGTDPGKTNWKRAGFRANLNHEPGSLTMIVDDYVL